MKKYKENKIISILRSQSPNANPTFLFREKVLGKLNDRLNIVTAPRHADTRHDYRFLFAGAATFCLIVFMLMSSGTLPFRKISPTQEQKSTKQANIAFVPFTSPYEFSQYLTQSKQQYSQTKKETVQQIPISEVVPDISERITSPQFSSQAQNDLPTVEFKAPDAPAQEIQKPLERVSKTNVQVLGIDEPDIAKVSGKYIYYSTSSFATRQLQNFELPTTDSTIPFYSPSEIKIIKAFPIEDLSLISRIQKSGNLLIADKTLIIMAEDNKAIQGYNISNPASPKEIWTLSLQNESLYTQARLYNGKVYIITQTNVDKNMPCPYQPLRLNDNSFTVPCNNIYHPYSIVPTDTIYTAMIINPFNGHVEKTLSFIGSSEESVVYMSENSLFIAYPFKKDMFSLLYSFYMQEGRRYLPEDIIDQIQKLSAYSISSETKLSELELILESYYNLLAQSEQAIIRDNITNNREDYLNRNKNNRQSTKIVKIKLDGFQIVASNEITGDLLNQFSLDEYNNNLRVATTTQDSTSNSESINTVYVLDGNLQIIGEVTNLGLNEKIYSVRFINNNAYVVTFRETDPFYVLDLSEPTKPQVKGQLKIPGYSSYLHRVDENKILGVGLESGRLKLSLFDVSDPENPKEVAKYLLDEYSSDVLSNHHAFLHDPVHRVFFIPAARGGYAFSYANNQLTLKATVYLRNTKRAIYFNDYLYVLGDSEIVVLDENSWNEEKRISL